MPEIDLQSALETNWIKFGTFEMEAHGDRVIVVQDDFKFGTECVTCGAKDIRMISQTDQRSVVPCPECNGNGHYPKKMKDGISVKMKCANCEARGWIICPDCQGTGVEEGLIAHPKNREERPTTGTIYSVGERVH